MDACFVSDVKGLETHYLMGSCLCPIMVQKKFKRASVWFMLFQNNHCAYNSVNMRTSVMKGQRESTKIFSLRRRLPHKVWQKRDQWRLEVSNDLVAMTFLWRASESTYVRRCTKIGGGWALYFVVIDKALVPVWAKVLNETTITVCLESSIKHNGITTINLFILFYVRKLI